jgi:predicted signal transduction protein with EAL and GGDEF domain
LNGNPFALAFVDVRMPPGIDGIETTARLLEQDADVNVVVCSAYSDHSWEELIDAIGETDRVLILKKPFDAIEVRQLAHALQRRWDLSKLVAVKVEDLSAAIAESTRELEVANEKLQDEVQAREGAMSMLAESNEQIRALAYQDGLTGLPNRRLMNEHLEKILARSRRKHTEFAVLFVDLDNFKRINDTVGHQGADHVLRAFAETLNQVVRSEDVLAVYMEQDVDLDLDATISLAPITDSVLSRLGGDEFVILLPEIKDRFAAGRVATRILERLESPLNVDGNQVFVTGSIGIATYPIDGEDAEVLIRNADTAMYHAKEQGKAGFQYYSAEMNEASVERLMLENGMRRALESKAFELHYQPQIDLRNGRVVGAEALLRWNDPVRGPMSPATFIPIAEDAGLILPIGEWVLEEACHQAVRWQRAGLPSIPVSINESAIQFRRQDVAELVEAALGRSGLDASLLRLEITETSLMTFRDRASEELQQLRALGVGLALDDVGTGYSSLSYIKSFPLDTLKLDRSFIAEMLSDETAASITEAIITMARILKLDIIAEGVETIEQVNFLSALGCDRAQGYYFGAAVSAEGFADVLAEASIRPIKPTATRAVEDRK